MYDIQKLTVKKRSTINSGAVVEIEVNESVSVPEGSYGMFYIRKKFAIQGVLQCCYSPFPSGYVGLPTVVVKNDSLVDLELLAGEEVGEMWVFEPHIKNIGKVIGDVYVT